MFRQGVGGGVAGAGDQAVGVAHLDHHGAVVGGVHDLGAGLLDGDALLGAELGELLGVGLMVGGVGARGVDDGDALDVDLVGVAQDDEVRQVLLDDLLGGLDGARVLALGQHDRLLVRLGGGLHAAQEIAHVSPQNASSQG